MTTAQMCSCCCFSFANNRGAIRQPLHLYNNLVRRMGTLSAAAQREQQQHLSRGDFFSPVSPSVYDSSQCSLFWGTWFLVVVPIFFGCAQHQTSWICASTVDHKVTKMFQSLNPSFEVRRLQSYTCEDYWFIFS